MKKTVKKKGPENKPLGFKTFNPERKNPEPDKLMKQLFIRTEAIQAHQIEQDARLRLLENRLVLQGADITMISEAVAARVREDNNHP